MPPAEQVGYYTNKMHFLKRHLLDELSGKRFALDFMQPVDAEALQVPTYYTIIRRPMDVGTIIKRVQNCYYYNVNELIQDFRLIISNCYTFNRPEDLVYRNGQKLEQFFEKVLAQMPPGDELITTKDPKAERTLQPKEKRASTRTESLCREELKKLKQCHVPQLDGEVRECFKDKWMLLSKKLSKHHFRTVESFRAQVDETFAQYRAQASRIFESTYYETMEQVAKHLRNKELNDLLHALGQAEQQQLPRQDSPGSSWHDRLVEGLNSTAYRLQQKLETSRLINMEQQAELRREKLLRQQEYSTAHAAHATQSATTMMTAASTASAAVASPQKPSPFKATNYVSDVERRAIQQQFVMLPLNTKIEIMHIIAQTEDISTDSCDLQWFDIKNFGAATLNLMKKAMHPHTKLNLRKMKPSEKEDLQRTLEMRLQNINQVLKGNRRKLTHRMRMRSTVPVKKRARYSTPANKTQRGAAIGASSSSASGQKRQWNAAAGRGGGGAGGGGAGGAQATGNSKDSSSDSESSDSSSSNSDDSSSDSSSEQSIPI